MASTATVGFNCSLKLTDDSRVLWIVTTTAWRQKEDSKGAGPRAFSGRMAPLCPQLKTTLRAVFTFLQEGSGKSPAPEQSLSVLRAEMQSMAGNQKCPVDFKYLHTSVTKF
jgi:hypothetical protein